MIEVRESKDNEEKGTTKEYKLPTKEETDEYYRNQCSTEEFFAKVRESATTGRVSMSAPSKVSDSIKKLLDPKEVDNFDIFEDRVLSLLNRWREFKGKNIEREGVAEDCIKYALDEINDGYTQALMEKKRGNE